MAQREATGTIGAGRARSLRREWSRAFAVMLALLLIAGIGTIAGVTRLNGQFSGTAHQRDRETGVVTALRLSMVDHEQIGSALAARNRPTTSATSVMRDAQGSLRSLRYSCNRPW